MTGRESVSRSALAGEAKTISWADMLDENDEWESIPFDSQASVEQKIRQLTEGGATMESLIVVPKNLSLVPRIKSRIDLAVKAAGLEISEDQTIDAALLSQLDFWSTDEKKYTEVILKMKQSQQSVLNHMAALSGFFSGLEYIPGGDSLRNTAYGLGVRRAAHLMILAYQEARYHTPQKVVRGMIDGFSKTENDFKKSVEGYSITGGPALKRLVSLTADILKKYVRRIVSGSMDAEKREHLVTSLEYLSVLVRASPTSVIDVHCRVSREEKVVRRGRTSEKVVRERILRPAVISDGPLNPLEKSIAKSINVAIMTQVPLAISRVPLRGNLGETHQEIAEMVRETYQLTDLPNKIVKERRNAIRTSIVAKRAEVRLSHPEVKTASEITPLEWESAQNEFLERNKEDLSLLNAMASIWGLQAFDAGLLKSAISTQGLASHLGVVIHKLQ
jgi:hypothetical protein